MTLIDKKMMEFQAENQYIPRRSCHIETLQIINPQEYRLEMGLFVDLDY
jgi:hypothetical protein